MAGLKKMKAIALPLAAALLFGLSTPAQAWRTWGGGYYYHGGYGSHWGGYGWYHPWRPVIGVTWGSYWNPYWYPYSPYLVDPAYYTPVVYRLPVYQAPVIIQPVATAPVVMAAPAATAVSAPPPPPQGECREYTAPITVGGKNATTVGTACRQPDGTWRIIN